MMPLNFIIQWTVLTFFLCFFLGLAYVFGGPYLLVFIFYKSSNRDCVGDFLNSAFSRGAEVLFFIFEIGFQNLYSFRLMNSSC